MSENIETQHSVNCLIQSNSLRQLEKQKMDKIVALDLQLMALRVLKPAV